MVTRASLLRAFLVALALGTAGRAHAEPPPITPDEILALPGPAMVRATVFLVDLLQADGSVELTGRDLLPVLARLRKEVHALGLHVRSEIADLVREIGERGAPEDFGGGRGVIHRTAGS